MTFPASRERKREGEGVGGTKREFVLLRNGAECSISWEQTKGREGGRDGGTAVVESLKRRR